MLGLQVEGLQQAREALGMSARRMAAAVATALSRTASAVREDVRAELPRIFDRPTPYTLGSMYVKGATASTLRAETWFKDERATSAAGIPATKYLVYHVEGGTRRAKRYERVLQMAGFLPEGWVTAPGKWARLDDYGNMSVGQIQQILSQLRLTVLSGSTRNMSFDARSQIRAQRRAGGRFFVVPVGSSRQPGVYMRDFYSEAIVPVLIFVRKAAYVRRFDYYAIAAKSVDAHWPTELDKAIGEQVTRMNS